MLSLDLMLEVSRRQPDEWPLRPLLNDACIQAAYCLDAPNEVQDGAEWFEDEDADICGAVPRVISIRAGATGAGGE